MRVGIMDKPIKDIEPFKKNKDNPLNKIVARIYETPIRGQYKPDDLGYAHRVDYPNTCTVLALDQGDRYEIVYNRNILDWRIEKEQAFSTAINNSLAADANIERADIAGRNVYFITGTEFAAIQAMDLAASLSDGTKGNGVLIGIPSSDHSYLYELKELSDPDLFNNVMTFLFYNYEVYSMIKKPLTWNVYWYQANEFLAFDITVSKERILVRYPQLLQQELFQSIEERKRIDQSSIPNNIDTITEIEFFNKGKEIMRNKKLQSIHTDVATGEVKVFDRDSRGKIIEQIDQFNLYDEQ